MKRKHSLRSPVEYNGPDERTNSHPRTTKQPSAIVAQSVMESRPRRRRLWSRADARLVLRARTRLLSSSHLGRTAPVNSDLMASQLDFTIARCPSRRHFTLTDYTRPLPLSLTLAVCRGAREIDSSIHRWIAVAGREMTRERGRIGRAV